MKIGVATYSLRNEIKNGWTFEQIADKFNEWGLEYVEINNFYLKPEELPKIVEMFKSKGITTNQLTVDGNNYFQKKESKRIGQFEYMKKWIDAANKSGIKMVRANMGSHAVRSKKKALVKITETFRPILKYCESLGISHAFENHGSLSSDVEFQLMVKEQFPSDKMGYLLDTGNYNPKDLIYKNIGKLGKSILVVHAKTYAFDENGEETKLNFKRIISELNKIGFDGIYSIEFEGHGDAVEGIEKTIELLKKYL